MCLLKRKFVAKRSTKQEALYEMLLVVTADRKSDRPVLPNAAAYLSSLITRSLRIGAVRSVVRTSLPRARARFPLEISGTHLLLLSPLITSSIDGPIMPTGFRNALLRSRNNYPLIRLRAGNTYFMDLSCMHNGIFVLKFSLRVSYVWDIRWISSY